MGNKIEWKLIITKKCKKDLEKLGPSIYQRISRKMTQEYMKDPYEYGIPLRGKPGFWRFRVGDYRIVCKFQNKELIILAIHAFHRQEGYDWIE